MSFVGGYKSKIALTGGTILTYSMLYEEEEANEKYNYLHKFYICYMIMVLIIYNTNLKIIMPLYILNPIKQNVKVI